MKQTLRQIFIENLRYYRKQKRLSQLALATEIEKSSNYINGIENGNTFPSVEIIEEIADALGIKSYQLFMEQGCPANAFAFNADKYIEKITKELCARLSKDVKKEIFRVFQK